jgi:hypothetical protein
MNFTRNSDEAPASARQLTTQHCHAVPTRASQSDVSSLPSRRPPDPSTPTMTERHHATTPAALDSGVHLRSDAATGRNPAQRVLAGSPAPTRTAGGREVAVEGA